MKKSISLGIVILLIEGFCLSAQDPLSNGKALNFPFRKYGVSIGNSYEFNGIRINFADKNVKKINGLNVTFWIDKYQPWELKNQIYSTSVKGISIGVLPTAGSMQPINLGIFRVAAEEKLNGLSISGFNNRSNGNINGISISGVATKAEQTFSGIAISGFGVGGMTGINGLAVGGIGVFTSRTGNINGVASSLGMIVCRNTFRGLGASGVYLKSNIFKGVAITGYSNTNQMFGLSLALYNRTDELHGLQLGLLNFAGNNPKGLRMLPFINLHLRK